MAIGEKIKKYRKEAHMSQKELGDKLGVSQQMITQYETEKRIPKIETLTKIADVLNVPVFRLKEDILTDFHTNNEQEQLLILLKMLIKDLDIEYHETIIEPLNGEEELEETFILSWNHKKLFLSKEEFNELLDGLKDTFKEFILTNH